MISSAIWRKTCTSEFFKDLKIARVEICTVITQICTAITQICTAITQNYTVITQICTVITNLHCDNTNLHCDNTKLHCGNTNLHCDNTNLHCDNTKLHCDNTNLHCDNTKLHCLGLIATALSQSELRNFFMYIIKPVNRPVTEPCYAFYVCSFRSYHFGLCLNLIYALDRSCYFGIGTGE